jgi:hypothetical protein
MKGCGDYGANIELFSTKNSAVESLKNFELI